MAAAHWQLRVCGINHKTASVEQREPLQLGPDDIARAHSEFGDMPGVLEATIISTCNRIEFYSVALRSDDPVETVAHFYQSFRSLDIRRLEDSFYVRKGKHAADHLFRVSAGIDSMVLGENQILSQVRAAYSSSCAVKTAGKIIHRLFHHALRVGKQARADTEMGKGACSVSSAATELLKTRVGRDARPRILFIGAGRMITLAADAWSKLHHGPFVFVNRTPEHVEQLARRYKASCYGLDRLPEALADSDLVITCTGAPEAVITSDTLDSYVSDHPDRELLMMDMAIPRDVECDPERHPGVTVLNLEDVQEYVRERQRDREAAIPEVERLIDQRLSEFAYWYDHVRHEFIYNGLGEAFEDMRHRELDAVLASLSDEQRELVDRATTSLVRRLAQLKIRAENDSKPSE